MSDDTATSGRPVAEEPYPSPAVGWYATLVLAFLYWMSLLDRFIISLMIDPIKADLGLTDVQLGVIQGIAFLVSFVVFGFIFGALADWKDRRRLIFIGVTVWSLATAACGLAQNFWHMLVARAGLGAGEASLNPCATSMISDLFPRERLTSAMAVYSLGSTIGSGTALMLGGTIIYWVSSLGDIVLPVIGQVATWQAVFFIVGLPGLLLALVVFTIPEPVRRGRAESVPVGRSWLSAYTGLYRFVKSRSRFFLAHYTGFTLAAGVVNGCVAWYAVHMSRSFGWSSGRIGLYLGMVLLIGGIIGKLASGWSVDAMYRRGYRDAQLRWYAGCLLLAAPTGIVATTSANPWIFLALIGVFAMLVTPMHACAMASLNMVTPNQLRGTGVAVYTTIAGLLGGSLGTVLIPMISQEVFGTESAIGLGMATLIGVSCPLGALFLATGFRAMREAMAIEEGGAPVAVR